MLRQNFIWGLLGAVLVACCLGLGVVALSRSEGAILSNLYPTAIIEFIPAPTLTPSPQPMVTSTAQPADVQSFGADQSLGLIRLGDSVQIYGTQGDGLRLRAAPGLDSEILFLAFEGEIFVVEDGPREASGYIWWYLVAPYDQNVKGWAVENYLKAVER